MLQRCKHMGHVMIQTSRSELDLFGRAVGLVHPEGSGTSDAQHLLRVVLRGWRGHIVQERLLGRLSVRLTRIRGCLRLLRIGLALLDSVGVTVDLAPPLHAALLAPNR